MNQHTNGRRYEVTRYDGQEITVEVISKAQLDQLNPRGFDHFRAACLGLLAFRTRAGRWIEYAGHWPRMGPVCLALLETLQLNAGNYLSPSEIAELCNWPSLRRNPNLASRLLKLRETHHEKGQPWFFESANAGGYRVRWAAGRTWVSVDLLPPANGLTK